MSLLFACGYDAEQAEDRGDLPEDIATVLDHELEYRTLWVSDPGDAEQAAEEFFDHLLGWSTDPVRAPWSEPDPRLKEKVRDPAVIRRQAVVTAESPDGRLIGVELNPGEPTPPDVQPEDRTDHRWRVLHVVTDVDQQGWYLSHDEEANTLGVHHVPDEQDSSVLLLYVNGETASFLLDDGELEPGAEADDLDLSALDIDSDDIADQEPATALVVHFDDEGRTLDAGGGPLHHDPRVPPPDPDDLPGVEPDE